MKLSDIELGSGVAVRYVLYACLLCLCIGSLGGYWYGVNHPKIITVDRVEKPVIIQGQHTATTTVQYVEKAKDEKTDVEVKIDKQVVAVMVNGKPYQFNLLQNEENKFDKGKIVLDQTSALKLDVVVPTIDRTKKASVGIGYGTNGMAGIVSYNNYWLTADRENLTLGVMYRF